MKKLLSAVCLLSRFLIIIIMFCGIPLLAGVVVAGCGRVVEEQPVTIETETISQVITSANGGTLSFSDGTSLSIPAGALSSNQSIKLEKPKNLGDLPAPFLNTILISAEGSVNLNSPATLTLKYNPNSVGTNESIGFAIYSPAVTATTEGGETNQIEYVSPEAINDAAGTVSVKINHFSRAWLYKQSKFYLVLDIPTKYLKKGDIMYVLTSASKSGTVKSGGRWLPGHAALYLGSEDPDATTNDGETVIESTKSTKKEGVQFNTVTESIKEGTHIYLGAYRPKNMTLSAADRTNIARAAKGRSDWGYAVIGSGGSAGPTGINCVALVEDAYDDAGKSILPEADESYLIPLEQFLKTEYVNEISAEVGENVSIGVIGVTENGLIRSVYTDDPSLYTVEADALVIDQGKASFYPGVFGYILSFTPTTAEAEKSYTFTFRGEASKYAWSYKMLTINVGKAPTQEVGGDYLTLAAVSPSAGTKITREVVTYDISVTFNYKLTKTTTGTYETGILHVEFGGMHGTEEVTYGILQYNYGNGTMQTLVTEEAVALGEGSKTFNVKVAFPAHDAGWTIFDYSPFFWAKLTRPDVYDRHFDGYGPDPVIVNYKYH